MGDMKICFQELDRIRRLKREELGIDCPGCKIKFRKACPTRLLPGRKCFCGYQDIRDRDALEAEFYRRQQEGI
jgi:hypothetical protein